MSGPGKPPVTILLQGGVASGKSLVAGLLASEGGILVDCDRLGHEVLEAPEIRDRIREAFGEGVLDGGGAVDRKALAGIVFEDPAALGRLEDIVHPCIRERVEAVVADARTPPGETRRVVVIDAAVAAKIGLSADITLFVSASRETRRRRAREERGWDEGELERREARQRELVSKERAADHVVSNDGGVAEVQGHVKRFWTDVIEPRR